MIFAGNCALESMGFKTFGFAGGREDVWEPEEDVYWGPENTWLGDERYSGDRELAEPARRRADGPHLREPRRAQRQPRPARRRQRHPRDVRPHGDERRGDRRADRRRPHLRQDPRRGRPEPVRRAASPRAPRIEEQGLGWKNSFGTGKGDDAITSGLEGAWTTTPMKWDNGFFDNLFGYEWELDKSPAGAHAVDAEGRRGAGHRARRARPVQEARAHDVHDGPRAALRPDLRADLAALPRAPRASSPTRSPRPGTSCTHRDMGPVSRCLGPLVPAEPQLWQDPVPAVDHELIDDAGRSPRSRRQILASGLSISQLVTTAWASASTFRGTDKRGGANGARIRLAPQKDWEVNSPAELAKVLRDARGDPEGVQRRADRRQEGLARRPHRPRRLRRRRAGGARTAGHDVEVPFAPGPHRRDAGADRRRRRSPCSSRPPTASATTSTRAQHQAAEELLVERAHLLTLTAPEMTVLVGGLRVLGANVAASAHGVFTDAARDADQRLLRQPARHGHGVERRRRADGRLRGARSRRRAS